MASKPKSRQPSTSTRYLLQRARAALRRANDPATSDADRDRAVIEADCHVLNCRPASITDVRDLLAHLHDHDSDEMEDATRQVIGNAIQYLDTLAA